ADPVVIAEEPMHPAVSLLTRLEVINHLSMAIARGQFFSAACEQLAHIEKACMIAWQVSEAIFGDGLAACVVNDGLKGKMDDPACHRRRQDKGIEPAERKDRRWQNMAFTQDRLEF